MITEELLTYIKNSRGAGASSETIKTKLKQNGWIDSDIQEAFDKLGLIDAPPAPSSSPIPSSVTPNVAAKDLSLEQKAVKQVPVQSESKPVEDFDEGVVIKETPKRRFGLIATIVLLILVGGGFAYGYQAGYFLSLDNVTDEAWVGAREASSGTFDTTVTVDASQAFSDDSGVEMFAVAPFTKGSLTLRGFYDVGTAGSLRYTGDASLSFGGTKGSANLRILDQKLFVELKELTSFGFFDATDYLNKWISVDYKSDQNPGAALSMLPFGGFNPSTIRNITPEQQDEILDITNRANFITVTDKLLPEKINEKLSYHFMFDLDREGVKNYLFDLKNYLQDVGKNDSYISSIDPTDLGDALDNIVDFRGEAWVGVSDHMPYKFIIDFGIKTGDDSTKVVKISIVSVFNKWNESVSVVAPENSISLEELIQTMSNNAMDYNEPVYDPVTGEFVTTENVAENDASIKGQMTSLRANAEIYFDQNSNYDGFCIKPDIQAGEMMMGIRDFSEGVFRCEDEPNAYAISTQLKDKTYFCVDSTGFAGTSTNMISGTVCPK